MAKQTERKEKNRIFPRELIRQCLKENNLKDGKSIEDIFCADMKKIYNAINEEQALVAFEEFSEK